MFYALFTDTRLINIINIYFIITVEIYKQEYISRGYIVIYLISYFYSNLSAPYLGVPIFTILYFRINKNIKTKTTYIIITVPSRVILILISNITD